MTNEKAIEYIAIMALERQIPLKPDIKIADGRKVYFCNNCGCSLCDDDGSTYCSFCGQKVDWSDK